MLLSLACGHCDQSGHWSRPRVRHCSNPVPARRAAAPAPRRVRMQQRGHEFVGEVVLEFKRGRCSLRPRLHPVPSGEADQEAQPDSDMHECHAGRCEQHGSKLGVRSEANDRRYSEHLAAPFLVGATCDDRDQIPRGKSGSTFTAHSEHTPSPPSNRSDWPRVSARRSLRVLEKSMSRSGMQLLCRKHSPLTPGNRRIVSSN